MRTGERSNRARSYAPYSSKIIKAGALIGDTKTLLSHWDLDVSVKENIERIHRENIFGKASRSRIEDILAIFRSRYLSDKPVALALIALVRRKLPPVAFDRLLYFHSARADRLLHDVVTELLVPMRERGLLSVGVHDVQAQIKEWVEQGKTVSHWSEITVLRAAQESLAALRDFGVLQGVVNKTIAPAYLPVEAFAYVAFYLKQHQPSGDKLIELPDWNLFFLRREGVERFLFEAHQRDLLEYHVAGSVTRLTFPVTTLEEYANVLAKR